MKTGARGEYSGQSVRRLMYDADYIFGLPDRSCVVCLTEQEKAWIRANLDYGMWGTRWISASGESVDMTKALDLIEGLADKLMPKFCNDLTGELYQQHVAQTALINAQRRMSFVPENPQTIDDLNPPLGGLFSAGGTGGTEGADALCLACEAYVRHKLAETIMLYRVLAGLGGLATGLLTSVLGALGAIIGGAVLFLTGVTLNHLESAAADDSAITGVSCDLYRYLKSRVATQENFTFGVDALTPASSDESTIVGVLQSGAGSASPLGGQARQSNYLHFLQLLGAAVVQVRQGWHDCTCDVWCYFLDLKTSDFGYVPYSGCGVWENGTGIVHTDVTLGGTNRRIIQGTFPLPIASQVTEISYHFTYGAGTQQSGVAAWALFANEFSETLSVEYMPVTSGERTIDTYCSLEMRNFSIDIQASHGDYTGSIVMTGITIHGTGENPYGVDNC